MAATYFSTYEGMKKLVAPYIAFESDGAGGIQEIFSPQVSWSSPYKRINSALIAL